MTVFVSKKVTHPGLLALIEKRNAKLINTSMISFEEVDFQCPANETYDTVFFSSPRSVIYFLEKCQLASNSLVGCIGKTTKQTLVDKGIDVDFIGHKSGHPAEIAKAFEQFVGSKKVLFPQSDRSNRSMQQQLSDEQVINLIVYKTVLTPVKLQEHPDFLVFTSPSNVESYIQVNEVNSDQQVIAWGETTEKFLNVNGLKVNHVLKNASFNELTSYLQKIL